MDDEKSLSQALDVADSEDISAKVLSLLKSWGDFSLVILYPNIATLKRSKKILPETVDNNDTEFVYPISDSGSCLATSKAQDIYCNSGFCKMHYTIEKMVSLFNDKIKAQKLDPERSVEVLFYGHKELQRKAFESLINLDFNVIVNNFEPGEWGDNYLDMIRKLEEQGYGFPPRSPRKNYRKPKSKIKQSAP